MAAELWRQAWGIGKEVTAGTAVAPTRRLYVGQGDKINPNREAMQHSFSTGTRQATLVQTVGSMQPGGSISMPVSATELVEMFLLGINGGVTPTGAGATKTWEFTPGTTLDSGTVVWLDGKNHWEMAGTRVSKWKISGNVKGENTFSADLMGTGWGAYGSTLTALPQRTPVFHSGWETQMWVEAFDAAPSGSASCGTLINWEIEVDNGGEREYAACNTQAAVDVTLDNLKVSGKLVMRTASAKADIEYSAWLANTPRHLRLLFGANTVFTGSDTYSLQLDLPVALSVIDLGGSEAKGRAYEFSFEGLYAPTLAYGLKATLINDRATAW